jgi:hypothetical protein
VAAAATPLPSPSPQLPVQAPSSKRNERPAGNGGVEKSIKAANEPTYFYEFAQPDFVIRKIVIEHDDRGSGKITFTKKLFSDSATDPLQVSPTAMDRINAAYTALNFLDSNDIYQYEKDYSHLGVMTFRLKKGEKDRTAVFNYTTNKDAKALSDEYRKLGNQFIWIFDLSVARENQPLETPRLMDSLESFLKRDEMSDPTQLVPLLKSLIDDERVPLITRNHAAKLIEKIEKERKK